MPGIRRAANGHRRAGLHLVHALAACALVAAMAPTAAFATDPGQGTLNVHVVDDASGLVEHACVEAELASGGGVVGPVETDANGDAVLDVDAGDYKVHVYDCTGTNTYVGQWVDGVIEFPDAATFVVTDGGTTPVAATLLRKATISVTVQDPDANVLDGGGGNDIRGWASPNANGCAGYAISSNTTTKIPPGTYRMGFTDYATANGEWAQTFRGGELEWSEANTFVVSPGQTDTFTVTMTPGAAAHGHFDNYTSAAVRGAVSMGYWGGGCNMSPSSVIADTAGDWAVHDVQPDVAYTFYFWSPFDSAYLNEYWNNDHFGNATTPLTFSAGEDRALDVTLDHGLAIRGHVEDQVGDPIAGATVAGDDGNTTTAANGNFELTGETTPSTIRVTKAGYATQEFSNVTVGNPPTDLGTITMAQGASIHGHLTQASNAAPMIGTTATATAAGKPTLTDTSDSNGDYSIDGFTPDTDYALHFEPHGSRLTEWP